MSVKSSGSVEVLFLKIFKVVVLLVMGLSLIGGTLMLFGSGYFYMKQPTEALPAQAAPKKSVGLDEFINGLKPAKPEQKPEEPPREKPEPPAQPAAKSYLEEARKMIECLKDSNAKSDLDKQEFSEDTVEEFRKDVERAASRKDRGQPYVADAARVICAILLEPRVIEFRKQNKAASIFIPAVRYHLTKWDELKEEERSFEAAERRRISEHEADEERRIGEAKQMAKTLLLVAAGAFGLFMAIALYLIIAAMESNLRRISATLEDIRSNSRSDNSAPGGHPSSA